MIHIFFIFIRLAVDDFYARLIADESLKKYFLNVNVELLKWHQYNFMSFAFTEIPEGIDVVHLVSSKHARLFDEGLSEKEFDIVAGHFVSVLQGLGVKQELIDEAVTVIVPLRPIFEEGAKKAKARKTKKMGAAVAVAVALVAVVLGGVAKYYP